MSEKDQLLKQLYGNMSSMRRQMSLRMQDEYGLPASQCEILFLVNHEGPTPLKDLAKAMQLTPGAITQLVEALERAGYVERIPSKTDRRITTIGLTEAGLVKVARSHSGKKKDFFEHVFGTLSVEELQTMNTIQRKIIAFLSSNNSSDTKES